MHTDTAELSQVSSQDTKSDNMKRGKAQILNHLGHCVLVAQIGGIFIRDSRYQRASKYTRLCFIIYCSMMVVFGSINTFKYVFSFSMRGTEGLSAYFMLSMFAGNSLQTFVSVYMLFRGRCHTPIIEHWKSIKDQFISEKHVSYIKRGKILGLLFLAVYELSTIGLLIYVYCYIYLDFDNNQYLNTHRVAFNFIDVYLFPVTYIQSLATYTGLTSYLVLFTPFFLTNLCGVYGMFLLLYIWTCILHMEFKKICNNIKEFIICGGSASPKPHSQELRHPSAISSEDEDSGPSIDSVRRSQEDVVGVLDMVDDMFCPAIGGLCFLTIVMLCLLLYTVAIDSLSTQMKIVSVAILFFYPGWLLLVMGSGVLMSYAVSHSFMG